MVAGYHTPDSERNVLGREEEDRHSRTCLSIYLTVLFFNDDN